MDNTIWVAFITGLTAGGLSCLAVQGGLLSSAIAHQVEQDMATLALNKANEKGKKGSKAKAVHPHHKPASSTSVQVARPIVLFLAAKLVAYTILGALLGLLGQVFQLSPLMKGILQLAIGIFMVGNAFRMFNIHPIFRYFNFEPPHQITRFIRRRSKNADSATTPLLLGLLTVLIPCGVTQAMMALAMGLGSPLAGASTMFAFVMGTTPLFFGVTYLATRLSSMVEGYFMKIVAITLLILGLITANTGLNLLGSPVSFSSIPQLIGLQAPLPTPYPTPLGSALDFPQNASNPAPSQAPLDSNKVLEISVGNSGYSPYELAAPAGQALSLHFITKQTFSCARALVFPSLNLQKVLPASGDTVIKIPAQKSGTTLRYTCSMGMYVGLIHFQ